MNEHELARDELPLGLLIAEALGPDVLLLAKGDQPVLTALVGAEPLDERAQHFADRLEILGGAQREA